MLLLGACTVLGGCHLWATGGNVMFEAFAVHDDYKPAVGAYAADDPAPDELAAVDEIVVLPFYCQTPANKVELRGAVRVDGRGGQFRYPAQPYLSGLTGWSGLFRIDHAAIAFAPRCWPHIVYAGGNPPGGTIWERTFPADRAAPVGVDQLCRVCLYRRSRAYDDDVDRAINDGTFFTILQMHLADLQAAIDASRALRPPDRRMMYEQLLAVARSAAARVGGGQRRSVYEDAARAFQAHVAALAQTGQSQGPAP
jgi:hypothetical protein